MNNPLPIDQRHYPDPNDPSRFFVIRACLPNFRYRIDTHLGNGFEATLNYLLRRGITPPNVPKST